jgi:hypothetical protein
LISAPFRASDYEKQGRLEEVGKVAREVMADAEAQGDSALYIERAAQTAGMDMRYGKPPAQALAPLLAALKTHPLEAMDPLNRPYPWLVHTYARAGRVDEARRLMREYETVVPEGIRRAGTRFLIAGALAAEKRDDDALEAYREFDRSSGDCGTCGLYEIATITTGVGAGALYALGQLQAGRRVVRSER